MEKHIATYFQMVEAKETALLSYFEATAAKGFTCVWRDERVYHRDAWHAYLKTYLNDATTTVTYEYRIVSTPVRTPERVVVRVVATEVRHWRDQQGLFGPAGHTLQYRESFDIDFVFVYQEGAWLWERLVLYGLDKRAHEQVQ